MIAAATAWQELTGTTVEWDFRPLSAFNDQPILELASAYDVMVIDHPAVAKAAADGALRPLEELIDDRLLATLRDDGLGPSAESYRYGGSVWALAVDGACHVSAGRADQFGRLPASWQEALALVERLGPRAAMPLTPADAFCGLLSIAATIDQPVSLERPVSLLALEMLSWLGRKVHDCSWDCSPPQLLERMVEDPEIVYLPLTFGYVTYSGERVMFGDAPTSGAGRRRPVLGGAGLAISATSDRPAEAARFCTWICGAGPQREIVLASGGQPASRSAWSGADSTVAGGFFAATSQSMNSAWVRPRREAWPDFQRAAAVRLAAGLHDDDTPAAIRRELWCLAGEASARLGG
jgi:multiple sugar transport system substrate-binding protein